MGAHFRQVVSAKQFYRAHLEDSVAMVHRVQLWLVNGGGSAFRLDRSARIRDPTRDRERERKLSASWAQIRNEHGRVYRRFGVRIRAFDCHSYTFHWKGSGFANTHAAGCH
jgi:hypothetical protein